MIFVHVPRTGGTSIERALGLPRHNPQHIPAVEIRNLIGTERWDAEFSFAFVRDPVERVASFYRRWAGDRRQSECPGLHGSPKFSDWSLSGELRSQWDMVSDGEKPIVRWLGRYERIGSDFQELCRLASPPGDPQLPRLNTSDGRRPIHVDPQLAQEIRDLYAPDVALLRSL